MILPEYIDTVYYKLDFCLWIGVIIGASSFAVVKLNWLI